MIKSKKVTNIKLLDLFCDKCGNKMIDTGYVLMTSPPQYNYTCECGYSITTRVHYPTIECEYADNWEDETNE